MLDAVLDLSSNQEETAIVNEGKQRKVRLDRLKEYRIGKVNRKRRRMLVLIAWRV